MFFCFVNKIVIVYNGKARLLFNNSFTLLESNRNSSEHNIEWMHQSVNTTTTLNFAHAFTIFLETQPYNLLVSGNVYQTKDKKIAWKFCCKWPQLAIYLALWNIVKHVQLT